VKLLRAGAVSALAALLLATTAARADAPVLEPRYDLVTDGLVTGTSAAATLTLLLLQKQLAPTRCRWCDPPGFDADLSRSLRWHDPKAAARGSDALAIALAGGALGYGLLDGYRRGDPEVGWENAFLVTEATSVAMLLDSGVKYAVGRQRPDAWRGRADAGPRSDRNLSFFSGHTTFAFALASSSSTLLLSQHAPHAGTYSVLAFGAAATVAYLRVAAEKHYPSDVLVGAGVGTLVGWAIPHFFHAPRPGGVQVLPAPGGIAVVW
jgi:hypothetical protein